VSQAGVDRTPAGHLQDDVHSPILVGDLDLDRPLPDLVADGRHGSARLLVRVHSLPVGEVVVPLARDVPADLLASAVREQLGDALADHLRADGLPATTSVGRFGLPAAALPACFDPRRADPPPITVAIATRDRTDRLMRCLASLERVHHTGLDVVVVDNAPSSNATAKALAAREWVFPLQYVREPRPGLAVAHNAALPFLGSDLVAFTDDDVEVDAWWPSAVAAAFRDPDVVCVTGLILPARLETPAQQLLEEFGGFTRGFTPRTFSLADPPADPLFPFTTGRCGSGANMAFRADWLRRRGGFDPATGTGTAARGGDDLSAFLEVLLDGGVLAYEPAALVRHWHDPEYTGLKAQAYGYGRGLGAYLTAAMVHHPRAAMTMLRRAPRAVRYLRDPASAKNRGKTTRYPVELTALERTGLLHGPLGYLASRWQQRDVRRPVAAVPLSRAVESAPTSTGMAATAGGGRS
jgi:hypothetical protein